MSDPLPPLILEAFAQYPSIQTIEWDGEVKVNGLNTGSNRILFETLWDYFVESPHVRYEREGPSSVACR